MAPSQHVPNQAPEAQVLSTPSLEQLYEQHKHLVEDEFGRAFGDRPLIGFERDDVLQEGRIALWIEALLYEPSLETAPFADLARGFISGAMEVAFQFQP